MAGPGGWLVPPRTLFGAPFSNQGLDTFLDACHNGFRIYTIENHDLRSLDQAPTCAGLDNHDGYLPSNKYYKVSDLTGDSVPSYPTHASFMLKLRIQWLRILLSWCLPSMTSITRLPNPRNNAFGMRKNWKWPAERVTRLSKIDTSLFGHLDWNWYSWKVSLLYVHLNHIVYLWPGLRLWRSQAWHHSISLPHWKRKRNTKRNSFVANYIEQKTGVVRTAKQVGSRIQQLNGTVERGSTSNVLRKVSFTTTKSLTFQFFSLDLVKPFRRRNPHPYILVSTWIQPVPWTQPF